MSEKNNSIKVISGGNYKSYFLEKMILGYNKEYDLDIIKLKVIIDNKEYISTKKFFEMEFAVIDLQRLLPKNIQIACCQTCKYGNFSPLGDSNNEIFCLLDYKANNKTDVIDIMDHARDKILPRHELLYWCDKYEKINKNYYTYNDWAHYFEI